MAVAVKNSPETSSPSVFSRLPAASLVGVVFVLGSLAIVFKVLPMLWWEEWALHLSRDSFVNWGLLVVAMFGAAAGLCLLGSHLAGPEAPHGLRAGIFTGLVGLLVITLITQGIGLWIESWVLNARPFGESSVSVGIGLTVLVGLVLLFLFVRLFFRPTFEQRLLSFEDQGWFTLAPYKRSQGQRVRRGTILGILVLVGCGIYTMLAHRTLETGSQSWDLRIPFTGRVVVESAGGVAGLTAGDVLDQFTFRDLTRETGLANVQYKVVYQPPLTLLPGVKYTLPLLLAAAALWLAYRIVNFPVFADFLIATEAELNKVSWTTRRRLVQDTIVVLVTVVLLTVFLFFVDQLWAFILTRVGVLHINPSAQQQEGPKEIPW